MSGQLKKKNTISVLCYKNWINTKWQPVYVEMEFLFSNDQSNIAGTHCHSNEEDIVFSDA